MSKIRVNEYTLKNPNIKEDKKILNMSDLHGNIDALKDIKKYLESIKVDFITIPGDLTDSIFQDGIDEFTKELKDMSNLANMYIVLGNHDTAVYGDPTKMKTRCLEKYPLFENMKDFENGKFFADDFSKVSVCDDLDIYALNLPKRYYANKDDDKRFDEYIRKINKLQKSGDKFNLLLVHSPNSIVRKKKIIDSYITEDINLVLAGHNHGGLVPTFIQDLFKTNRGFVGPYGIFFPSYAHGIINGENKSILTSNGVVRISDVAYYPHLHKFLRLFFLPEVDLINLKNGKEHEFKLEKRNVYRL